MIHQTQGERNYHIFYQVCAASTQQKMLQDLGVSTADVFNYSKTCTFHPLLLSGWVSDGTFAVRLVSDVATPSLIPASLRLAPWPGQHT